MEIGSVIELDSWENYQIAKQKKDFFLPFMAGKNRYKSVFYQSGRNAIEALMLHLKEKNNIDRILLPDYMCQTVKDACKRAKIQCDYYLVDRFYNFSIEEIEKKIHKNTCLYIAHFFGKKIEKRVLSKILNWKNQDYIIIEDVTLSLFSSDTEEGVGFGNYTLGSIRKWLPIPDGGFVSSQTDILPQELKNNKVSKFTDYYFSVQVMKRQYVKGGFRNKTLKKIYMDYYALSIKELFSDYALYPMSEWTQNYLNNFDFKKIIRKRMENYDYLYEKLKDTNKITLKIKREEGYLPLGMVIICDDRDDLLQYLIKNNVYCNIHWNLENETKNTELEYLAKKSITIPCDQRYGIGEMDYIASIIRKWERK